MEKKLRINDIALVGVMAAAVFAASTFLQIPIPTPIDNTRLHMGNVMCLLAGFLLGPIKGGLAAGLGSAAFDLVNPLYIASAPFTFVFKFLMAFLCGRLIQREEQGGIKELVIGAVAGQGAYILLYLAKSFIEHYFVFGLPIAAVTVSIAQKAIVSTINGCISVLVAVPLAYKLRSTLRRYLSR